MPAATPDFPGLTRQILERSDRIAAFTEEPNRTTRPFLCPAAAAVQEIMDEWMKTAGLLQTRIDVIGNLIGRRKASDAPNRPALVIGSHLDTVPNAGRYDGVLGVLLGIAVAEALHDTPLPFALEVVGFSEEEGVRFGVPYLGSLAFTGNLPSALLKRTDANGISVSEAVQNFGLNSSDLPDGATRPASDLIGYIEAHIEQGPVLERDGVSLGVADAIAGQSRLRLRFTGHAGHAGTTPMDTRQDALAGAAEFILAVEGVGNDLYGMVATVGRISVLPDAGNVIPGQADISLDLRHASDSARETALKLLLDDGQAIAARRKLEFTVLSETHQAAVPLDATLCSRLAATVETVIERPCPRLTSGAGHDAAILAPHTPTALLFLRSPNGGLSHHPDEAVHSEDVEAALRVLVAFILNLVDEMRPLI